MLPMSICTKKGPLPYEAVPCYPDSEYAARYTTPLAKAYFDMEIASICLLRYVRIGFSQQAKQHASLWKKGGGRRPEGSIPQSLRDSPLF